MEEQTSIQQAWIHRGTHSAGKQTCVITNSITKPHIYKYKIQNDKDAKKYKTTNTNTNKRQTHKQNQRKSYHLKGDVSPTAHERADRQYPSDIEQV